MKSDPFLRRVVWVFVGALAVYIFAYTAIEHQRTRQGPWQLAFTNDANGSAVLLINQPRLALTNVQIAFPGAAWATFTNTPDPDMFTQPRPTPFAVPFGRCVFLDLTSLPGTIVLELFGHEIQLLPRVLTIDRVEKPWQSNEAMSLPPQP